MSEIGIRLPGSGIMTVMFDNDAFTIGIVIAVCALILIGLRVFSSRAGDSQLGGEGQSELFRYAARTGTVPPEARHEVWRGVLEGMVARRERAGALSSEARGAIVGVIVGAVALLWSSPVVAVGVAVVVAGAFFLLDRRAVRREVRLLAALRQLS